MEKPTNMDKIIKSDSLEKFNLNFFGIGAENVCFETKGSIKKLIKVNIDILKRKIMDIVNDKEIDSNILKYQTELMKQNIEQEKIIIEIFGDEHVLKNGYFHSKIPLNKELIIQIMGKTFNNIISEKIIDKNYEIEMIMQTQLIAEELKNQDLYQTEDYSTDVITHDDFINSKNIEEGLHKIENITDEYFINSMKEKIKENKFKIIIKEITEKIITYTKKKGQMIDIFGPNNITMFIDKDGNANYHLIDVLLPGLINGWNINIKDDKNFELLRHYYTYYYSLKKLADELKIENILKPQDLLYFKDNIIPSGDWYNSEP